MASNLVKLSGRWWAVEDRVKNEWGDFHKLIVQYRSPNAGTYSRLLEYLRMLAQRLTALGVNNAQDPVAAADPEVQALLTEIVNTKALCRKVSKQFWDLRAKSTLFKELYGVKDDLDAAITKKAAALKKSKSLPALEDVRTKVNDLVADLEKAFRDDAPHKPTEAWIN
jgi:hypothetical protein